MNASVVASALYFVQRWLKVLTIESVHIRADGVAIVRHLPVDQVLVNYAVATALWLLSLGLSALPFGDEALTADIVRELVDIARRLM
jgi:hypothetical protein